MASLIACSGQELVSTDGLNIRLLGSSAATGNDASETTAAYFPKQGTELIAIVVNTKASAPDQPAIVANSLTWTELFDTNFLSTHRLTVWYAKCGSGATVGTFNANTGATSQTGWAIAVMEVTGSVLTGVNGVTALRQNVNVSNNVNTNLTVTFGTLGKRTLSLCLAANNLNSSVFTTSEAAWTKFLNINYNTPATAIAAFYQLKNTDTTCLMTNAAVFTGCGVGVEFVQEGNFP
jgi:hypothetical protein